MSKEFKRAIFLYLLHHTVRSKTYTMLLKGEFLPRTPLYIGMMSDCMMV